MAVIKIVISVKGSADLTDALDRVSDLGGLNYVDSTELVIVRAAGACRRCRANQDPLAIPIHMQCNCRVELKDSGEIRSDGQF